MAALSSTHWFDLFPPLLSRGLLLVFHHGICSEGISERRKLIDASLTINLLLSIVVNHLPLNGIDDLRPQRGEQFLLDSSVMFSLIIPQLVDDVFLEYKT